MGSDPVGKKKKHLKGGKMENVSGEKDHFQFHAKPQKEKRTPSHSSPYSKEACILNLAFAECMIPNILKIS